MPIKTSSEKTRNYPLYVFLTLQSGSDRDHPLSISKIQEKIISKFGNPHETSGNIDRSTVARILLEMEELGNDFPVRVVMNTGTSSNPCYVRFRESDEGKSPKKYYYYEQPFSKEELLTIRDSVEAYNYLAAEDITNIINRVIRMAPDIWSIEQYASGKQDQFIKDPHPHSPVLYHIKTLSDIIQANCYANISYCNYGIDGNLVVRDGYPKLFKPIKLLWGNGFYYCACKKENLDTPVNLRLDRIKSIEPVESKSIDPDRLKKLLVPKDLIPSRSGYRLQHPVMFGGKVISIVLLVRTGDKNGMINALVDTFGRDIKMTPAEDSELAKAFPDPSVYKTDDSEQWITAQVKGTFGGTALFAVQYCENVRVVSPESIAEEVKRRLHCGLLLYE
ncbi:MAG: WYL domain-containing protein [Lachnospiraceae bacterium]|nr:WYL domain-containing protein [Lachnospiraceae bacterium]